MPKFECSSGVARLAGLATIADRDGIDSFAVGNTAFFIPRGVLRGCVRIGSLWSPKTAPATFHSNLLHNQPLT